MNAFLKFARRHFPKLIGVVCATLTLLVWFAICNHFEVSGGDLVGLFLFLSIVVTIAVTIYTFVLKWFARQVSPKEDGVSQERTPFSIRRATLLTLLLVVASIWAGTISVTYLTMEIRPGIIDQFDQFSASMPAVTSFCLRTLRPAVLFGLAPLVTIILIFVELRVSAERRRFLAQIGILVLWHLLITLDFYGLCLPLFRMGEIVSSGEPSAETFQPTNAPVFNMGAPASTR